MRSTVQNSRFQILVVDDDVVILKLLNHILAKEYDIVVQSNGIEAFRWLEEGHEPDIIISDLMMPYFDGSLFVKNLKISGFYRDIPVILLSAADDLLQRVDTMPFKVDHVLKKPFNPTKLKSIIEDIVKNLEIYESH